MAKKRPLLILISSNRNYGWVVPAFLKANARWADYIVITDQMSTDGSREMYAKCNEEYGTEKVIVVDDKDMQFKEYTRAKVAFEKGREIAAGRDAIYFALDIDEVLPANWMNTEDGKRILHSKPGDMFGLLWADLRPDRRTYTTDTWQYKVFHDNGVEWPECNVELHVPHLPYSSYDIEPTRIVDFPNMHFGGRYNEKWRHFKMCYLQMLDIHQKRAKSVVAIYRSYQNKGTIPDLKELKKEWFWDDFDIFEYIDLTVPPISIALMKELIKEDGIKRYRGIDIWDKDICESLEVQDPRTLGWKMVHAYLKVTQPYRKSWIVKAMDKMLKYFV